MAAQNAHHAAIAELGAVGRASGCAGGVDENIPCNLKILSLFPAGQFNDSLFLHPHIGNPGVREYLYPCLGKKISDLRFNAGDIVQIGMTVPRELYVLVHEILIDEAKKFSASHGHKLFSGRIPAVIAHDPAHQSGAQEHIRPFHKHDLHPLFPGRQRSGAPGPSSPNHDRFHSLHLLS
jgi:hypothetical protein